MDANRFDALSRTLSVSPSRRAALQLVAGGALGGLLAWLGSAEASATHTGCRHTGAVCTRPGQCCSGRCAGNGTCQKCTSASQCPAPAASEPCKRRFCTSTGRCVIRNKANDAPCPDDGNLCTKDVCNDKGECTHPADATKNGTECEGGKVCQDGICASAETCTDDLKNGTETDIDCGGTGGCPRCSNGKTCRVNSDCASTRCCIEAGQIEGVCRACCINSHCTPDKVCQAGTCVCGPAAHDCDGDGICETCGSGCASGTVCGQPDEPSCLPDCVVIESTGIGIGADFCCAEGYCPCGGACCPDCYIDPITEEEFCCSDRGGVQCRGECCSECTSTFECPPGGRLGSIRR